MFDYCCPGDLGGVPCGFCCARVRWLTLLITVLVYSFDLAFNTLDCLAFGMRNAGHVTIILWDGATLYSDVVSPVACLDNTMVVAADARNPRQSALYSDQSGLHSTVGHSGGSLAVVGWKVYEGTSRRFPFCVDVVFKAGKLYGSFVTGKCGLLPPKPDMEDQKVTIPGSVSTREAWPRFPSEVRDDFRIRMLSIEHTALVGHGARYLEPQGGVSATDVLIFTAHKFVQKPTDKPGLACTYGSPMLVPLPTQHSTLGGFGDGGLHYSCWCLDFSVETPQGDDRTAAPLYVSQWLWALPSPTAEAIHGCTKNLSPTTQGDLGTVSESLTCSYRGPVPSKVKLVGVVSDWCGARVAAPFEHAIKSGMYLAVACDGEALFSYSYLCLKIKLVRPPSAAQWAGLTPVVLTLGL